MTKVKWLIEDILDTEHTEALMKELKRQGIGYKEVKYIPFSMEEKYDYFHDDECVVFYGSLNLASVIRQKKLWVPGVYCNYENLKCSTYYSYYGKYLLNSDYIMLPILEFKRRQDEIYK